MSCCLREQTMILARDYIDLCLGTTRQSPSPNAEAMRSLAKEMEKQYQSKFNSLLHSFIATCGPDPSVNLKKVMEELVGDGILNWGRVVSLFTFTGLLARQLYAEGASIDCFKRLAETIADYLGGEKREWLIQNEGWEGFCKFFQTAKEVNQESTMKTALFAAAGVGIAGITFLLVR